MKIFSKINSKILEILACPICKSSVDQEKDKIICNKCKLSFPIEDKIPIMLIEKSEKYEK